MARGRTLLQIGDIVAARLQFQRAADLGALKAATAVGWTYDPAVYEELKVRGLKPDPKQASEWYLKGARAGDREAQNRLTSLKTRGGQ